MREKRIVKVFQDSRLMYAMLLACEAIPLKKLAKDEKVLLTHSKKCKETILTVLPIK